jgi:hypothetical protein
VRHDRQGGNPTLRDLVDRLVEWAEAQAGIFQRVWEQGLDASLADWDSGFFSSVGWRVF